MIIEDARKIKYEDAKTALKRGLLYFTALQADDGHWPAENSGPNFYTPPFVSYYYKLASSFFFPFFYIYKLALIAIYRHFPNNYFCNNNNKYCAAQLICLYITGHLEKIFTPEHVKELLRHIYNMQVRTHIFHILEGLYMNYRKSI